MCLAQRFQKVIPTLIHKDQNGFIKNRFIGYNIRTVIDCIDYLNRGNKEGFLAFVDFEKAFDKLNWHFMDETLKNFNFGENVRKWIKVIYSDIESCTINNGIKSRFFKIRNGVRQGDPMSSLLFILAIEVLAIAIRENDHIKGITIQQQVLKLSLFADDINLIIADILSLRNALNLISIFYFASGLKINYDKTEIMQIWKISISYLYHKPFKLIWTSGGVKSLGIHYFNNVQKITNVNLRKKVNEFQQILERWSRLYLTLKSKITIIKNLALPKLIYTTNIVWDPQWLLDEVNSMINQFMWGKGKPQIQSMVLIQDYTEGGLRHLHFNSFLKAQKIMWIKRLHQMENKFLFPSISFGVPPEYETL